MTDRPLPEPVVHNVVATATLGMKLDLKTIALKANNAEYKPKRFSAVILRIRDPKTTALIFASGKMVLTGAKDETSAKTAAKKHLKTIQKCGFGAAKLSVRSAFFGHFTSCFIISLHQHIQFMLIEYRHGLLFPDPLYSGL